MKANLLFIKENNCERKISVFLQVKPGEIRLTSNPAVKFTIFLK